MRKFELINMRTGDVTFCGQEVTKRRPCPVCGHGSWCLRDEAKQLTICPRTPGDKQIGDAGFMYSDHLGDVTRLQSAVVSKPKPAPLPDMSKLSEMYIATPGEHVSKLAEKLGVSAPSLVRLGCGWSFSHWSWSFPMQNATGRVVGIRLRRPDGFKYAATGSRNALFVPRNLAGDKTVYIEEGPTSTAALLDMGFDAIGRPSCGACVDMTVEWVSRHGYRNVVIVANKDETKKRPNGTEFRPGQEGANKLADAMMQVAAVKVIEPLKGKDSRDWLAAGATRNTVEAVANAVKWRVK